MTESGGQAGAWYLAGFQEGPADDEAAYVLTSIRELDPGERDLYERSWRDLERVIRDYRYNELVDAYNTFRVTRRELDRAHMDRMGDPHTAITAHTEALGDWLRAFRQFLDHTLAAVTKRYGEGSLVRAAYDEVTKAEFDRADDFSYRLCCKLRHYSEHVSWRVLDVKLRSFARADGSHGAEVVVTINPADMLERYDGWNAMLRAELQAAGTRPLSPELLLDRAMAATERVLAAVVSAESATLAAACDVVEALAAEVPADAGGPVLTWLVAEDLANPNHRMQITTVRTEYAATIRAVLQQARQVLERGA